MSNHNNVTFFGEYEGNVKSYLIGLLLAVVLTLIPFIAVMSGNFSRDINLAIIAISAIVQVIVHLVYFLHMSPKSANKWNLAALGFMLFVIGVIIIGSLWIMYHLDMNMMYP